MSIFDLLPTIEKIKIVDIGAMILEDESDSYAALVAGNDYSVDIIGFEPNIIECQKLNERVSSDKIKRLYLPYAIGDGTERMLHLTNASMTSSLYEPNLHLLKKFPYMDKTCKVIQSEKIKTRKLDDIIEVSDADYLKVDVQGAEKDIFNNAISVLNEVMIVHTEVEFVQLYKNQPLFSEVDISLRQKGFQFMNFSHVAVRSFNRWFEEFDHNHIDKFRSQALWADAVYVKDFMRLEFASPDKLLKLVVILHEIYKAYDFCHYVLGIYDKKGGSNIAEKYKNYIFDLHRSLQS